MTVMSAISMTVNGRRRDVRIAAHHTLLDVLRDDLGLTGSKECCLVGECGACTVILNGRSVDSCLVLAVEADGGQVLTVEGLADGDKLHPMQEAFRENHALQCGFCTPGMVMSAVDLVKENPDPSEQEIREWLEGNICRCTGYHNIVKAIKAGAQAMRG